MDHEAVAMYRDLIVLAQNDVRRARAGIATTRGPDQEHHRRNLLWAEQDLLDYEKQLQEALARIAAEDEELDL